MKKDLKSKAVIVVFMLASLPIFATTACSKGPGGGAQGGPPPEAITACEGKSEGDSASFTGRRGETLEGVCKEVEGQLAVVPENMPEGRPDKQ